MRLSGIADSIHHFHCGVHSGVKAYGVFTALDIIIDGAGNTHTGDSRVGQISGAPEGTIAADNHNAADTKITAGIRRLLHAGRSIEFRAAGGKQGCAAPVDNIGNTAEIHFKNIPAD